MNKLGLLLLILACNGCVSSRVVLEPETWLSSRKPDYVDYYNYYFFGLKGHGVVDFQKVCMDQKAQALEQTRTFEDGFISVVTLGIYTPVTVRVWCGE